MVRLATVVLVAALAASAACGGPSVRGPVPRASSSVANVLLTGDETDTPAAALPPGVAQVQLRLVGDFPDTDSLVAEVVPVDAPDRTRRWPVETVTTASDGASATVTLPAYALPPGGYVVTIWRGDADAVRRYPLRVVP